MHIEDLLIIWSKLCPECNYLKLLEEVCHVAKFRMHEIQTACQSGMTLCKCFQSSVESQRIMDKLL